MAVIFPFGEESQPHSCRPGCLCKVGQCPMSFIKAVRWSPQKNPSSVSPWLPQRLYMLHPQLIADSSVFKHGPTNSLNALWPMSWCFAFSVFGSNMFRNIPKPPGSKPSEKCMWIGTNVEPCMICDICDLTFKNGTLLDLTGSIFDFAFVQWRAFECKGMDG